MRIIRIHWNRSSSSILSSLSSSSISMRPSIIYRRNITQSRTQTWALYNKWAGERLKRKKKMGKQILESFDVLQPPYLPLCRKSNTLRGGRGSDIHTHTHSHTLAAEWRFFQYGNELCHFAARRLPLWWRQRRRRCSWWSNARFANDPTR